MDLQGVDLKPITDFFLTNDNRSGSNKNPLFVCFFFIGHWYVHKLYKQNIQSKQEEIDRLVHSNNELNLRLLAFADKQMNYKPKTKNKS